MYPKPTLVLVIATLLHQFTLHAQNPSSCATIGSRSNSNGQATNCPNVSGTLYALNFVGTSYANVPTSSKTGNLQLTYSGINMSLAPYAITRVWQTNGSTSLQSISFGPAGIPSISGGNTQVSYCFYGSNMPTIGTVSLELTNPQNGQVWGICSYDASCSANCTLVTTPVTLPVTFGYFRATAGVGTVKLDWATEQEQYNKGFSIERSTGDGNYMAIGFVPSMHPGGTGNTPTAYTFTDPNPPAAAVLTYRLRQQDLDGNNSYSTVVSLHDVQSSPVRVYSQGGAAVVQLPAGKPVHAYDIYVYDTEGKLLHLDHAASGTACRISGLASHRLYFVKVGDPQGSFRYARSFLLDQ